MSKTIFMLMLLLCMLGVSTDVKAVDLNILTFVTADDHTIFRNSRNEVNQMEMFGSDDKIGIYYEISAWPADDANPNATSGWLNRASFPAYEESKRWRYKIERDTDEAKITSVPASKDIEYKKDKIHENLVDFIKWVHENHPADTYMLILKGHGDGELHGTGHVEIADIGLALQSLAGYVSGKLKEADPEIAKRLKIITFSSCLMQTVGVAYHCSKNGVEAILGSSVPTYGMDYKRFLKTLQDKIKDAKPSVKSVSESIVEAFNEYVRSLDYNDLIVSAINAKKIKDDKSSSKDLKKLLNAFVKEFITGSKAASNNIVSSGVTTGNKYWEALRTALAKAQRYDDSCYQYVDMVHFFELVKAEPAFSGTAVKNTAEAILAEVKHVGNGSEFSTSRVIMKYKVHDSADRNGESPELDNAYGLSLLMPADTFIANIADGKTRANITNAFKTGHPEAVLKRDAAGSLDYYTRGMKNLVGNAGNLDLMKSNTTDAGDIYNWKYFIEQYKAYADTYVTDIAKRLIIKFQNVTKSSGGTESWTGHVNTEPSSGISHKADFH